MRCLFVNFTRESIVLSTGSRYICACVSVFFLPLNIFETIVNVLYSFRILRPQF